MRQRLRKADRIRVAGKKNNQAQYKSGSPKRKWIIYRQKHKIKSRAPKVA